MPVDYVFQPSKPDYPQVFADEKARISQVLDCECQIEHFGSTSIEGLGGKGIIDIYILASRDMFPQIMEALPTIGYDHRPNAGNKERYVFTQEVYRDGEKIQRFHVHISTPDSPEAERSLTFRDYLIKHPDEVEKYAEIKKNAIKAGHQTKDAYVKAKIPYIEEVLTKARAKQY